MRVSPGGLWEDLWPRLQKGRRGRRPGLWKRRGPVPWGLSEATWVYVKGQDVQMHHCHLLILFQAVCQACLTWGPLGDLVLEQMSVAGAFLGRAVQDPCRVLGPGGKWAAAFPARCHCAACLLLLVIGALSVDGASSDGLFRACTALCLGGIRGLR